MRPCLKTKEIDSCASGIVCTTSYKSYTSILLFSHLLRTCKACLQPSGFSLLFALPTFPHAGVSSKAGYSPLNGIIWSKKCGLDLGIADAAFSTHFSPYRVSPNSVVIPITLEETWASEPGETRELVQGKKGWGRIFLCKACVSCLLSCFSHNMQCLAGGAARHEGRLCQLLRCLLPCMCVLSSFLILPRNWRTC